MITEKDLREAIAECEGQRNPNANTCIKLAAFYIIKQHMFPDNSPDLPQYSYSGPIGGDYIDYNSGTEFSDLVNGRRVADVLPIIDELMSTISVVNPKLYASVIRELS